MSKTIILDDLTYNTLKKEAKKEDRSISKTAKRLIQMGLQAKTITESMTGAGAMAAAMGMGAEPDPGYDTDCADKKPYTVEEWSEYERKRKEKMGWKPKKAAPDMSEEELIAMNKQFKEGKNI